MRVQATFWEYANHQITAPGANCIIYDVGPTVCHYFTTVKFTVNLVTNNFMANCRQI